MSEEVGQTNLSAKAVLALLESQRQSGSISDLPLFAAAGPEESPPEPEPASRASQLAEALSALDPDALTPREALESLYRLKLLADDV